MRLFSKSVLLFCCILSCSYTFAQVNLSGIINKYAKVTAVDAAQNMVTVSDLAGLKICDTVLIMQMKGAAINQTNTVDYGTVTNYNGAGNYEKAIIYNIVGNTIFFRNQLLNSYNPSLLVQLVSIPQFSAVGISGTLTGKAWDGNTGGIIAFEVSDIVAITGLVDASGIGFRGGSANTNAVCALNINPDYSYLPSSNFAGFKGESVVVEATTGKGAAANGGGGGSCGNGGGGGGSNSGAGGLGGKSSQVLGGLSTISGIGGRLFSYIPTNFKSIFLGGGGGGGHQDNNLATAGGNGGGIVYITGKQIVGGGTINASGKTANNAGTDGAGGGGGGGGVLLNSSVKSFKINVLVNGGNGGNNLSTDNAGVPIVDCFATGGGGGGGVIAFNGTIDEATTNNSGGNAGSIISATSPCFGTTNGAVRGANGQTLTNVIVMPSSTTSAVPTITATITTTAATCTEMSQVLTANLTAGANYQWQRDGVDIAGQTTNVLTATTSGVYRLKVTIGCNTVISSEEIVTINGQPIARIINGTSIEICQNSPSSNTLFAVQGVGYTYQWLRNGATIAGATTATLTVTTVGLYKVNVTICGNTMISGETSVSFVNSPNIIVVGSKLLCPLGTNTLIAFPRGTNFQWYRNGFTIAGAFGDTYIATSTGNYTVITSAFCNLRNSDDFIITAPISVTQATITGQNTLCTGKSILLRTETGVGFKYSWFRNGSVIVNATQNSYTVTQSGDYSVTITDECQASMTSAIFKITTPAPPDNIFIRGNGLLCNGESRLISTAPKNPLYKYQWTLNAVNIANATDITLLAKALGRYTLKATDSCGTTYESPIFTILPNAITSLRIESANNRIIICPNEILVLTAIANLATSDLQWQRNGIDIPNAIGNTFRATSAGNYTVKTRDICNNVVSAIFTLQVAIAPEAVITGNLVFCAGRSTILTANAGQDLSYQWFRDGESFLNASSQFIPVAFAGKFKVLVSNTLGCSTMSEEVTVTSSRIDETQVKVTPTQLVCEGETVRLSASGGTKYEWSPTTGLSNPFIANPIAAPSKSITYKVKISNNIGCFVERNVELEVIPAFKLDFEVVSSSDCGQKSLVQINNTSTGLNAFNEINWDMGDGNGNVMTGFSPTAYIYAKGGTYTIKMTVNNRNCTKTFEKTVFIESLFTSNVITPNLDNKNEKFEIDNPNEQWKLEIVDRYGKKVFESENYNNDWSGHGITTLYYYKLTSPTGKECRGWIQVLL